MSKRELLGVKIKFLGFVLQLRHFKSQSTVAFTLKDIVKHL